MAQRSVECRSVGREAEARTLATAAGAVFRSSPIVDDEYRIVLFDDREELWDVHTRKHGMPLSFRGLDRRTGTGNLSLKQPIGKAIGSKSKTVVDATAGLGHDAALLACMGWDVLAIERDAFLASTIQLSIQDAERSSELWNLMRDRLRVQHGDSKVILRSLDPQPDVVYLDPMFRDRRKPSALPKKPAQILQALAEPSQECELLEVARAVARRVVVKRPKGGPSIAEPNLTFRGRLVRYDVYLGMAK